MQWLGLPGSPMQDPPLSYYYFIPARKVDLLYVYVYRIGCICGTGGDGGTTPKKNSELLGVVIHN